MELSPLAAHAGRRRFIRHDQLVPKVSSPLIQIGLSLLIALVSGQCRSASPLDPNPPWCCSYSACNDEAKPRQGAGRTTPGAVALVVGWSSPLYHHRLSTGSIHPWLRRCSFWRRVLTPPTCQCLAVEAVKIPASFAQYLESGIHHQRRPWHRVVPLRYRLQPSPVQYLRWSAPRREPFLAAAVPA